MPSANNNPRTSFVGATYPLNHVRTHADKVRTTKTVRDDAAAMGMGLPDIQTVLRGLRQSDFYKTMESDQEAPRMLDVYQPHYKGKRLYVKFRDSESLNVYVVTSFKPNGRGKGK